MHRKFTPNAVRIEDGVAYLELTNRKREKVAEAIIDLEDLPRVLAAGRWFANWHETAQSYYVMNTHLRTSLHRFVMNAPKGQHVDHTHHNTLDCRKSELRVCSHTGNMQNRQGAHKTSVSGIRGVYRDNRSGMWRAEVRANNRKYCIGSFKTIEEAAAAVAEARERLHGEFAA